MDDAEVVDAFVAGARQAYGPTLHIEGDALMFKGWWQVAFRIDHDAFILRDEEPDEPTDAVDVVARALAARGLLRVLDEHPLVQALTYTELSLAGVAWSVWAPDEESGNASLSRRVGAESEVRGWGAGDEAKVLDLSAELEGARRIAGLPPLVVLAIGVDPEQVNQLRAVLPQVRVESRAFGEIQPEACGDVNAQAVVIDTSQQGGRDFLMEFRAAACGRFLPVAAVSEAESPPAGADVVLRSSLPAALWATDLLNLLPT